MSSLTAQFDAAKERLGTLKEDPGKNMFYISCMPYKLFTIFFI